MMVLGREEPLTWNKQIYALNEITNEIELSRVEDDGLNRYSFLWQGEFDQRDIKFTELIRHVSATFRQDPCWFLIWKTPKVNNNPAQDPKMQTRGDEGWATHAGEEVTVGQKAIDLDELAGPEPSGHKKLPRDGGMFILMGDVPAAPDLTEHPVKNTMSVLANSHEMAPSSPFLSWVRERSMTLVYSNRHKNGRLGLIVATPHKLELDGLKEKGFADTLNDGEDAPLTWT